MQRSSTNFSIHFTSSRDILLLGIGIFVPFGSFLIDDLRVKGKINYNRNMILYISGNFQRKYIKATVQ